MRSLEPRQGIEDYGQWENGLLERNDVIAGFDRGHALANGLHNAGTFMAKDYGEGPLGILARQRVRIWRTLDQNCGGEERGGGENAF